MRYAILLILCIAVGCAVPQNQESFTILKGVFKNLESDSVQVEYFDYSKQLSVNSDGTFQDTLELIESARLKVYFDEKLLSVYIIAGETTDIIIDPSLDENVLKVVSGAIAEDTLWNQILSKRKKVPRRDSLFQLEEKEFMEVLTNLKSETMKLIKASSSGEEYKNAMTTEAEYTFQYFLKSYETSYPFYSGKEPIALTDSSKNMISDLDWNDELAYKNSMVYQVMVMNAMSKCDEEEKLDYYECKKHNIANIKNEFIRSEIIHEFAASDLLKPNEDLQLNYDFVVDNTISEKYLDEYAHIFDKLSNLKTGSPSPKFENYTSQNEEELVSLGDFKGKLLLIDIWATWCGPCLYEIPFLEELALEYESEDFSIISISADKQSNKDIWLEMVEEKQNNIVQLFAPNSFESAFIQDYQVKTIPRFILIDKKGNVISADAPSPSEPELKELIDAAIK